MDKYIESRKFCSCMARVSQTNNADELTAAITANSCNPVLHKSPSRKPAPCTVIRVPPEGFNCLGNTSFIVASKCSKMSPLLVKSLPLWLSPGYEIRSLAAELDIERASEPQRGLYYTPQRPNVGQSCGRFEGATIRHIQSCQ